MANITPAPLGPRLTSILEGQDIQPGDGPSYELCKAIWLYHPLGDKIAAAPVRLAQSQDREIKVPGGPEEMLVDEFRKQWTSLGASDHLLNVKSQSRVYGLASIGCGERGKDPGEPLDLANIWKADIFFNVLDPLNTSGLIINQDPNSPDFQKFEHLRVNGIQWDRSRTKTLMNEQSVYIAWTSSAFSYAGRSVFQRSLYPLKSFISTMRTDDMVAKKAGLLVAKIQQAGSIIDRIMQAMTAVKRALLGQGQVGQVLSIGSDDAVESLNLRNLDTALRQAREDILKNIATGAGDMPAKLLTQEAFVEGFGEGTEDAKLIAMWIDRLRIEMAPEYRWMDEICMRRAWSPEFYETVKTKFPDQYGRVEYQAAFYRWRNRFQSTWPSLIKEPPSELVEVDDVRAKAAIAAFQVVSPELDPENRAKLVETVYQIFNSMENLFPGARLELDYDKLLDYMEQQPDDVDDLEQVENAGAERPFSGHDAARTRRDGVVDINRWIATRPGLNHQRLEARLSAVERALAQR